MLQEYLASEAFYYDKISFLFLVVIPFILISIIIFIQVKFPSKADRDMTRFMENHCSKKSKSKTSSINPPQ